MIFASELSKCRKIKLLFGVFAFIFGFVALFIFPLYLLLKDPAKSLKDYAVEYVYYRMNFTPETVNKAYYNPLQYQYPLYDEVVKDEIEFFRNKRVYQIFVPNTIIEEKKPELHFSFYGVITRIACYRINKCEILLKKNTVLKVKPVVELKKFTVEMVK